MSSDRVLRYWKRLRHRRNRHRRRNFYTFRDKHLDKHYLYKPEIVEYICKSTDFFDCAEEHVVALLQRRPEVHALDREIIRLSGRFDTTKDPLHGMIALLAQAPRASLAQIQMDKFPHGYRNKQERLYELIDFNDTLVSTVLLLNDDKKKVFADRAKQASDRICKRVGAPCFSDEQWTAIIRGLTREIAVYLAATENGLRAWLTDRVYDAMGIDIQVQDPENDRYINIDVKTPSSFRRRMEQLVREGRLTEAELMKGDERSYIIEFNGGKNRHIPIIVLCILPDLFGDLADWRFVDSIPMAQRLNYLIREHGIEDGKYGMYL